MRVALPALLLSVTFLTGLAPTASTGAGTGFLVLTPDRGFLGNEETREAFSEFREAVPNAVLGFVTQEHTAENLRLAFDELKDRDPAVEEVVVLPLFLTEHHALYRRARVALDSIDQPAAIRYAEPFGTSYLAEEILFDRVRELLPEDYERSGGSHAGAHGGGHGAASTAPVAEHATNAVQHGVPTLLVVGSGAASEADAGAIEKALEPVARRAAEKFGLAAGHVAVLYAWSAKETEIDAAYENVTEAARLGAEHGPVIVVPFNLAPRLTTMMADWTRIERNLARVDQARFDGTGVIPHPNVTRWLIRTANSFLPLEPDEIGVILVPHGSDYNWNQAMRKAMAPIRERYVTAEAFSMVDPYVVERAVRSLESKGMKAAVLVRIFSLESSFQAQAEYILGLRPEYRGPHADRIASHLLFATAGGMEAHPLLAEAMLDRAREISQRPAEETVVLVAHGTGGDDQNAHWMKNLESIAQYIRSNGAEFRDVVFHTWREDWPEKRKESIEAIRGMVEDASENGGTALVIPVRTIDQGPEATFLEGLNYRHGVGFAPHPNFVRWLEVVIQEGVADLKSGARDGASEPSAMQNHETTQPGGR